MENTLERLLKIQGQPEQLRMEEPPAPLSPDQGAEEAAGAARQAAPPAPPAAQENKPSPAMLEAWRGAFKTFTRYAPALRSAASKGAEDAEAAALFNAAADEVKAIYSAGGDAEILAMGVYSMLEEVYRRESAQKAV